MPTSERPVIQWVLAALLVAAGIVAGWFLDSVVLAQPLPEGVLFGLCAAAAAALLAGIVLCRWFLGRALLIGGFVGTAGSAALVLLVVV